MTATTPEAILKKINNRKSTSWTLTGEEREQRIGYLFDLLYPKRKEKQQKPRGRPLKYLTEEDRRKANRERARACYHTTRGRSMIGNHWASRTPVYVMYMNSKSRAKKNNLPFNLTIEYLLKIFPEDNLCPILKKPFTTDDINMSPSLDRFIPELGYTIGNVAIISNRMNTLKSNGTEEEFRKLLHWMRNSML